MTFLVPLNVRAQEDVTPNAKSAVLIEATTGKILYQKNAQETDGMYSGILFLGQD